MKKLFLGFLAIAAVTFTSCSDDNDNISLPTTRNLTLDISGLEDLGSDYKYEGWVIVNGTPVSTGVFTVDDQGVLSKTSFSVESNVLASATKFVLSIEPAIDSDPAPAATKLLVGDFSNNSASLSSTGIVGDFSNSKGKYILATPTDGENNNEFSGVWFLDLTSGSPTAGLTLPTLSAGWKYEGWTVMNGIPLSTGTFTAVDSADDNAATSTFKGDLNNGPGYPGEDFIQNAPVGLTFPTDLKGSTIVISVEPSPDNSSAPFTLKPLAHKIPTDANHHETLIMGAGPVAAISGTVTR